MSTLDVRYKKGIFNSLKDGSTDYFSKKDKEETIELIKKSIREKWRFKRE